MQTNQTAAQKAAGCGSSALCYAALYMILLLPDLESIDMCTALLRTGRPLETRMSADHISSLDPRRARRRSRPPLLIRDPPIETAQ